MKKITKKQFIEDLTSTDVIFIGGMSSKHELNEYKSPLDELVKEDIVGAVLSMAVVFIANVLDVTVRNRKKLEDTFEYPVLGVIPRYDVDLSGEGDKRR